MYSIVQRLYNISCQTLCKPPRYCVASKQTALLPEPAAHPGDNHTEEWVISTEREKPEPNTALPPWEEWPERNPGQGLSLHPWAEVGRPGGGGRAAVSGLREGHGGFTMATVHSWLLPGEATVISRRD